MVEVTYENVFARNFMKCPDLQTKVMHGTHIPLGDSGEGGQFPKKFAGNNIVCPDLKNVSTPTLWVPSTKDILLGVTFNIQICTKSLVSNLIPIGQRTKRIFARNCMKYPDLQRKIMYGISSPWVGWKGAGGKFLKKIYL